jgi:regulator of RNase E activity RraA
MSMRARARGAVGSVVDGRVRDLQEQRELGYPVFSPRTFLLPFPGLPIPRKNTREGMANAHGAVHGQIFARDVGTAPPHELLKVTAVNEPVRLRSGELEEEVVVMPGDYLVGDLNGVVVLPRGRAEEALPLMKKLVEADGKIARAITETGASFAEASRRFRD